MTLTARLTIAMVGLALSTAGVVGMLTYRNLEKVILPTGLARLRTHVQRQGARLDEVISLARDDVLAFAAGAAALEGIVRARTNGGIDPQNGTTEQVWRARLARRFVADLQAKPGYDQFRFIGAADGGREIVRVDRSGPHGTARIVPDGELQAKANRDYFTETLKLAAGAVLVSQIDLNQEHGAIEVPYRPTMRVATPIYAPAGGGLFGILIINVDMRQTFARVNEPENTGGRVYLVNENGYYLINPQSERTFGFMLGRNDRVQTDYPELAPYLGKSDGMVGLIHSPAGESLGVTMLPLYPGGGPWVALIEMVPEARLLAPLALVRRSSLVAGGCVALLAAGLALGLARSLTGPLTALTRTVESFSSGQSLPVKVRATGEIGVLARAFEAMRGEVNGKTRALHDSERRFRALIEHSGDGIALIDAGNKILYVSPSVTSVEGYAPEELIGRNGLENTHPDDLPLVQKIVEQLVAKPGQPIPVLWRRRHKDGQWRWLEGIATNLLDDPAVGAIVTNYRDVTQRMRAEAEIHQLNTELEQRVVERTAELEAANKELEAFSYSVSHDLRAPLRAVDGFSQAVVEDFGPQLPAEGRRYLQTIREGAQRMGELIDDLLTFARLSRQALNRQIVDMGGLAQDALAELAGERQGRQIGISLGALPPCLGDPALLKQVWINLLSNALKYTRQRGQAAVEIGATREGEWNAYFVRDNGTGFDMQYAHKLFGVFQRLHRAEDYEGTGVGLAIVQRVIHRHGGRVRAEAAVDRGATFYFTLKGEAKS